MNCTSCGAPLDAKSIICRFCTTANELDLRSARRTPRDDEQSTRPCPRCSEEMPTIDIGRSAPFPIERCGNCLGLFFDPGELDRILRDDSGSSPLADRERLQRIAEEETPLDDMQEIRYVPCPVCKNLMNRVNYGRRSGVVVDTCKEHGVWLDGGELRRVLSWLRAGGPEHQENVVAEEQRLAERPENFKRQLDKIEARKRETDPKSASTTFDVMDVLIGLFD